MTDLRQALDDYLAIRRALGFKLQRVGQMLPGFVTYMEQAGAATITTELALAWAKQPAGGAAWWRIRLRAVRGFARHVQNVDPSTEAPPADLLPAPPTRATPYLYSESDVGRLMTAARALASPLKAVTYETLVGLLATTGMRMGEAIRLDRADLDWNNGVLTVRSSKFGKSREVPLHPSTLGALRAYQRRCDQLCPRPKAPSFFISTTGTRLDQPTVGATFVMLARQAGLRPRSRRCRPRPHDLRHSFAVRTLLNWYRAGDNVESKLPLLSTYLGHVSPASTYWYLTAAPELFALASKRLEHALEELA
jgi:integrase/recombinase XerD